ncbi:polynucleotide kinase [Microbacterium phage ASegato]|nr:polynucleotide kinase [Microbacterium phage ASegato]
MSRITIMRGLPASGKSGISKEMLADNPNLVRVNRDAIRWTQGTFPFGTPEQEEMVSVIGESLVGGALRAGKDVVIDACHLNPQSILKWFKIAKIHGVRDVAILSLEVTLATLFERDANREKSVGQGVIAKMAKRYKIGDDGKLPKAPEFKAAERPDLTPAAPYSHMLPDAYIVDTDGTVADHVGIRSPYDTSRYDLDAAHEDVIQLVNHLEKDFHIIGVSGRSEEHRPATVKWWLDNVGFIPENFFMRPTGDGRPDDVIKAEIYEKEIRGKFNIMGVLDDRARVLRMWRAKGLTTFAVGDTDNNDF